MSLSFILETSLDVDVACSSVCMTVDDGCESCIFGDDFLTVKSIGISIWSSPKDEGGEGDDRKSLLEQDEDDGKEDDGRGYPFGFIFQSLILLPKEPPWYQGSSFLLWVSFLQRLKKKWGSRPQTSSTFSVWWSRKGRKDVRKKRKKRKRGSGFSSQDWGQRDARFDNNREKRRGRATSS